MKGKRTKCIIYSRVSGFITPIDMYNEGKKSEFYSRKFYNWDTPNQKFINDFKSEKNSNPSN